MKNKSIKIRIVAYLCILICVAILINMMILGSTNRKQIARTSDILLSQIQNILNENKNDEQQILEELKLQYVENAKAVAYILEKNPSFQNNLSELKKIASVLNIDEIHLFDSNGMIYSGTVPKYYGLTFNSGEQVGFFKPMLKDKNLTMCQDVTPNTAESKNMMYAIVWDNSKKYMVQIGIEPVRLLAEFEKNTIQEVVKQMPVYQGSNIFVADIDSGKILGSTDKNTIGTTLYDNSFLTKQDDLHSIRSKIIHLNGYRNYCHFKQYENYIIAIIHSTRVNLENFLVSISIEIVWFILAGGIILYSLLKLINANKKIKSQMSILSSISDIYYSMHLINLSDFSIEKLEGNELMERVIKQGQNASDMLKTIVNSTLEKEYINAGLNFVDLSTLKSRLKNKSSIYMDAIDKNVGWLRITFITVETDSDKVPEKVIIATQVINDDKKREEELAIEAHRDELTGLLNRRSYENDLLIYPDVPPEKDFVYAAIDINGLKTVNDEFGHAAGDDLIKGAAECLKRTLGNYGRVYRTGGDEFVSMFFADKEHLDSVLEDLEKTTSEWQGELVTSLTVSIGCATKQEFQNETVLEMAKIADKRMYLAKSKFYSQKGIDRRGLATAHKALCNLYIKILKINLTEDSFSVVNMDSSEKTKEKGFNDKISQWLYGFGKSGQVHEEDLENYLMKTDIEYLKDYFKQGKSSISIIYRRKFSDDSYKHAIMEFIPADDYSHSNQSMFLYVKAIDL